LTSRDFLGERYFRWRGRDVSRLEALADVVFGFSLTLLVVALEVPKTSADLFGVMRGFLAFAICFAILLYLWTVHYLFFRRFGLRDPLTLVLNAVLLFLVLLYVYPLKFLFTFLTDALCYNFGWVPAAARTSMGERLAAAMGPADAVPVMVLYSSGYLGVSVVFILLYANAWRQRAALELDAREILLTRGTIAACAINGGIAAVSIGLAFLSYPALAGYCYFVLGPVHAWNGHRTGKRLAATCTPP
jgi:hypothetical protein